MILRTWSLFVIKVLIFNVVESRLPTCEQERSLSPLDCKGRRGINEYRTYDGSCNNLQFPLWGASQTPMFRLVAPIYEDGRTVPIGFRRTVFYEGFKKPNARDIVRVSMKANFTLVNPYHTAMLIHFGQIVAHDFTLATTSPVNCTKFPKDTESCFNIPLPPYDRRERGVHAFPLKRSDACIGQSGKREQINTVTSYIDASPMYGSNEDQALRIRDFSSDLGYMRINERYRSPTGKEYLPFDEPEEFSDCDRNKRVRNVKCFLSGDRRTSEQLMLMAIHTIMLREHNRIATIMKRINPHWSGDKIYQECRKLMGAIFQHLAYHEWLPKIVGPKGIALLEPYSGYQPFTNPSSANSFGVAVMRFAHATVPPQLERRDPDYRVWPTGHLPLRDAFFAPEIMLFDGGCDPLLRGALFGAAKEITGQSYVNQELTEHLFPHAFAFPQDLAARNIQRAREHGVPGYNEYREFCGLPRILDWGHFESEMRDPGALKDLQELYKRPNNMDLWVGGLHERPLTGSKLGPTFVCLLVNQFKRTRDGDRFWFENKGVFSPHQISAIYNYTLSKLICHNGDDIDRIQPDPFEQHRILIPCDSLPDLDLNYWRERPFDFGPPPPIRPVDAPPPPLEFGPRHEPIDRIPEFKRKQRECTSPDCPCRYQPGPWSLCNPKTGIESRTDLLLGYSSKDKNHNCAPFRTATRKCSVSGAH